MELFSIADNLSETEEKKLVSLLDKVGPKMPTPVYNAVAAKFVLVAIETVILRRKQGKVEVFLAKRPPTDAYYPNMLHSPGTILRASDRPGSYQDAFERVQKNELGVNFVFPPEFVGSYYFHTSRGPENSLVFLCEVEKEPKTGKFYDVRNLPENLLPHHYIVIAKVLDYYKKQ
ncbi:hypothetical protein L6255_03710 [Candidatus Parcubacteria bacterium]|nr:hypothetical protein [Patescibacteria group bacterium]MCG2689518.1 hypothetical protein [Candidatus Parcubacteria bacterium]